MNTDKVFNVEETNDKGVLIKRTFIICEVCGHANKETNAQCEMCSNYLHQEKTNVRK